MQFDPGTEDDHQVTIAHNIIATFPSSLVSFLPTTGKLVVEPMLHLFPQRLVCTEYRHEDRQTLEQPRQASHTEP